MFYCVKWIPLNVPWSLFMIYNNVMRHQSLTYETTCHNFTLLYHIRSLLQINDEIYFQWYYGRYNLLTSKSIFRVSWTKTRVHSVGFILHNRTFFRHGIIVQSTLKEMWQVVTRFRYNLLTSKSIFRVIVFT
jgi:hypothetical protein